MIRILIVLMCLVVPCEQQGNVRADESKLRADVALALAMSQQNAKDIAELRNQLANRKGCPCGPDCDCPAGVCPNCPVNRVTVRPIRPDGDGWQWSESGGYWFRPVVSAPVPLSVARSVPPAPFADRRPDSILTTPATVAGRHNMYSPAQAHNPVRINTLAPVVGTSGGIRFGGGCPNGNCPNGNCPLAR